MGIVVPEGVDLTTEDVFGDPNLALLAEVLRKRLAKLNGEGLGVCPPDLEDSVAGLLAEAVLEAFHIEERGWVR
jgi:hypothetical protein